MTARYPQLDPGTPVGTVITVWGTNVVGTFDGATSPTTGVIKLDRRFRDGPADDGRREMPLHDLRRYGE